MTNKNAFISFTVGPQHHTTHVMALDWPAGSYGIPRAVDGCPRSLTTSWKTGVLFQDCENTNPQTSRSPSYHLAGFVTKDVQREFCIKVDTFNGANRPPWPVGQYCVYQGEAGCPVGLDSGWVVWDDERNDNGTNRNRRNGTLPKGRYSLQTKIFFCCSTKGDKRTAIDLPLVSPFYLIAYASSSCQRVRGATATREFIYYETEYYTLSTKNDYGGAHPYRVTRSRYGHTIYYCYYKPNYCSPLTPVNNSHVYPARCARAQSNAFRDTCYIRCNPGFVPRDGGTHSTQCGEDGTWSEPIHVTCLYKPSLTLISQSSAKRENKTTAFSQSSTHAMTSTVVTATISSSDTTTPSYRISPSVPMVMPNQLTNGIGRLRSVYSRGRLVAGAISAGVVCVGVIAVFVWRFRRRRSQTLKEGAINPSKNQNGILLKENIPNRGPQRKINSDERLNSLNSWPHRSRSPTESLFSEHNPLYVSITLNPQPSESDSNQRLAAEKYYRSRLGTM
ncbi:uncharacterized protein LOC5520256 isoform X2 [Nematostella vectensis]|uniref:uncharacterized protein LOC5520256 isoform X2 n=1 Tax=Nematostella vectensis TaxID=45351 RepID=UPI00207775C4|nr:uncharacterized protein LOC5520256 isoform X2 [Nematostella vectensis]